MQYSNIDDKNLVVLIPISRLWRHSSRLRNSSKSILTNY